MKARTAWLIPKLEQDKLHQVNLRSFPVKNQMRSGSRENKNEQKAQTYFSFHLHPVQESYAGYHAP